MSQPISQTPGMMGIECRGMDVTKDPIHHDLGSSRGFCVTLMRLLRIKSNGVVWGGNPCSTSLGLKLLYLFCFDMYIICYFLIYPKHSKTLQNINIKPHLPYSTLTYRKWQGGYGCQLLPPEEGIQHMVSLEMKNWTV